MRARTKSWRQLALLVGWDLKKPLSPFLESCETPFIRILRYLHDALGGPLVTKGDIVRNFFSKKKKNNNFGVIYVYFLFVLSETCNVM